jgi:hypothetical protein
LITHCGTVKFASMQRISTILDVLTKIDLID